MIRQSRNFSTDGGILYYHYSYYDFLLLWTLLPILKLLVTVHSNAEGTKIQTEHMLDDTVNRAVSPFYVLN